MLPSAMKAKYEKVLKVTGDKKNLLDPEVQRFLANHDSISWKDVINGGETVRFQKEVQKGNVEVIYQVKNRMNKKKVKMVETILSVQEMKDMMSSLSANDKKTAGSYTVLH